MGLIVNLHQVIQIQVGISLGGRKSRMPQQFLNRAKVGPGLKQMCGIAMAQPVGCNLRPQPALIQVFQDDSSDARLSRKASLSLKS